MRLPFPDGDLSEPGGVSGCATVLHRIRGQVLSVLEPLDATRLAAAFACLGLKEGPPPYGGGRYLSASCRSAFSRFLRSRRTRHFSRNRRIADTFVSGAAGPLLAGNIPIQKRVAGLLIVVFVAGGLYTGIFPYLGRMPAAALASGRIVGQGPFRLVRGTRVP